MPNLCHVQTGFPDSDDDVKTLPQRYQQPVMDDASGAVSELAERMSRAHDEWREGMARARGEAAAAMAMGSAPEEIKEATLKLQKRNRE